MEIRPGSDAGLPALVAALGQRRFFSGRLASQRAGAGVCHEVSTVSMTETINLLVRRL